MSDPEITAPSAVSDTPPKHDKALVTVVIGEQYFKMWSERFKETWQRYAMKHGYDLLVITRFIDPTPRARERSIHWQKLLILEEERVQPYKDVVWLDADILINYHRAPCIVAHNNSDKIGLTSYHRELTSEQHMINRHVRQSLMFGSIPLRTFEKFYGQAGLPEDVRDFCNTGVLVLKPALHGPILREVYDRYEENEHSLMENVPLSYHLLKYGHANIIDPRFNFLWRREVVENYSFLCLPKYFDNEEIHSLCVNQAYHNCFFMHFVKNDFRASIKYVDTARSAFWDSHVKTRSK